MTAAVQTPGPRRGRWRILAPTVLLVLAGLAWSVFWFWAAAKADEAVDVWLAREARLGRVYACGGRETRGYPFRIEVECRDVSVRLAAEGGDVTAAAPRFVALAQVYDPKNLIGELHGPVAATLPDGRRADLSFGEARASARVSGRSLERASLRVATPRLTLDGEEIGAAAALEAHLRRAPDEPEGTYDLASALEGATSPYVEAAPVGSGPVSAELQLRASGLADLRPGPLDQRLRRFAEAGGKARVDLLTIARGEVAVEAKGEAELDTQGRAEGKFDVTARGLDGLIRSFAGEDGGGLSSLFGAGAKMLGKPAELDGQPASTYRVKLDKGRVLLGPFRLTRLPPAF